MNITIICVGKLKEKYLKDGIEEYAKRLKKYCSLKIIEVPDEKAPENLSIAEEEMVKNREGEKIKKYIKSNSYVIALDVMGKSTSSEDFAGLIERIGVNGFSDIIFVIGGSLGLSYDILDSAAYKLSFSKMTFPHQLFRLMLVEQIYRGFRINRGEPYHK